MIWWKRRHFVVFEVMDIFAITFYAAICGLLSLIAPTFGRFPIRLGIGAVVGVLAALSLPMARGIFLG